MQEGASTSHLIMFLKGGDLICVLSDKVELATWERIRRTFQAKGMGSTNLRGLLTYEVILRAWGNIRDGLELCWKGRKGPDLEGFDVLIKGLQPFRTYEGFGA